MKDTEHLLEALGESVGYGREYLERRIDLVKLEAAERTSLLVSALIRGFVYFAFGLMALAFLGLALGCLLARWLGTYFLAFLVVSFGFAVVMALVFVFRHLLITNPVLSLFIRSFYEKDEDDQ